jgi:RNA polymerase sigma-70 factor (sigma-E family)
LAPWWLGVLTGLHSVWWLAAHAGHDDLNGHFGELGHSSLRGRSRTAPGVLTAVTETGIALSAPNPRQAGFAACRFFASRLNFRPGGSVRFIVRSREAEASFEDFVYARSSSLLRTALLLTGQNRADAEDLLQIALERAYRHWSRLCRGGDPERYVRRILANASTDRWRRLARRPEQPMPAAGSEPTVPDGTAKIVDREYLLWALAALPPRQRAVLVLRYFDDMSEGETAQILGCSLGTVKSHAARALARLRAATVPHAGGPAGQRQPAAGPQAEAEVMEP